MTHDEWSACGDPVAMLDAVEGAASDRKLRLFAIEATRFFYAVVGDDPAFRRIPDAEAAFVEGMLSAEGVRAVHVGALGGGDRSVVPFLINPFGHARSLAFMNPLIFDQMKTPTPDIRAAYAGLLRDVFGDPFRPVGFDARWRSKDAVGLALAAYDNRDFSMLPILADALGDSGCSDAHILGHCRGSGPHTRGCWVVDAVLGRE
jgi:hypothetical protein